MSQASLRINESLDLGPRCLDDPSVLNAAEMVLQFVRIINQQADRMSDLINDLLDLGRMETGTLLVNPNRPPWPPSWNRPRNSFLGSGGAETCGFELPSIPL